jgi:hypothetical protein
MYMNIVTINGNKTSTYDAITWAQKNFGPAFKLRHQFPGDNWIFEFEHNEQASLFALKWA